MATGNASRTWRGLTQPHEIDELMNAFGHFHDACVREMHIATGEHVSGNLSMSVDGRTTVHMLVQRQFPNPSAIELRFEEVVGLNLAPPQPGFEAIIFRAGLFLRDGIIYWADDSDWTPGSPNATWVAARRAWWRNASEWMGPDLRYRSDASPD